MKSLVLAEKPSVGREIARVLQCGKSTKNYKEGKDWIVTWAMGHLVELADPVVYDKAYKQWKLDYLPMLPPKMKLKVIKRTSSQFNSIKSLLKRDDISRVVIATDAGREGELVARWILKLGGWKGKTERLWISSQTDAAIKMGFNQLKPADQYYSLFQAAESRAEADWIIGLNITRALTCKYDARLSAGRVQTPTLSLICVREKEIEDFNPQPFWTIEAEFKGFTASWRGKNGQSRSKSLEKAQEIVNKLEGKEALLKKLTTKRKKEEHPLAFDLTELQRAANRQLGFSAKKTLQVLQGLYERHKIVTYPRTDSRYITQDMVDTLPQRVNAVQCGTLSSWANAILKKEIKTDKRFVNDKKVSDHHAIIPTEEKVNPERLNNEEKQLWLLIARRFLAVLMPAFEYDQLEAEFECEGEKLIARGRKIISEGWKALEKADDNDEDENEEDDTSALQGLPQMEEGKLYPIKKVKSKQGLTRPPARYTEATLLSAMENAGRFIEDKTLKASIAGGGLGTPATRADIIEKLLSNHYIERQGKQLHPTAHGMALFGIVPDQFKHPHLTARWELRLSAIAGKEEDPKKFSKDIRENAEELIDWVKKSSLDYSPDSKKTTPCPFCGKGLLETNDKKGRPKKVCLSLSCGYEEGKEGDQRVSRNLVRQYAAKEEQTFTLADMIKAKQKKK